jgi:hypothetical protein
LKHKRTNDDQRPLKHWSLATSQKSPLEECQYLHNTTQCMKKCR